MGVGGASLNSPEFNLDLNKTHKQNSPLNLFMREILMIPDVSERRLKVSHYVDGLQEEIKKIQVFKRELPLSMLLLNDAIEELKEEVSKCRGSSEANQSVMEEFIPLKNSVDEDGGAKVEKDYIDKKNWMSSAQLWTSNAYSASSSINFDKKQHLLVIKERVEEEDRRSATENPYQIQPCKYWNGEGAFMPFKGFSGSAVVTKKKEDREVQSSVPGLSILVPGLKTTTTVDPCLIPKSNSLFMAKEHSNTHIPSSPPPPLSQSQQAQRKQRRCWSPELHRRFVSALQQLGGSQAATPKQIRELMKVDGLTNDEVKSHLQKYRLHTRRNSNGSTSANQPLVLGGLWVPEDNQCETSKSQSDSPQGPLQLASANRGNSMEDEEDEKSETYSWKGHSHKSSEDEA